MQTLTVSEARANLYRIIDQAAESHQPIAITGKRANAVLLSAEDWSAIQETLYLLGVPGMRESILKGMATPIEECGKELDWWAGKSSTPNRGKKNAKKLAAAGLKDKALRLLEILKIDPFQNPPPFEKLVSDLAGSYSRRINIQHHLIYQVSDSRKQVKVLRLWSHYE